MADSRTEKTMQRRGLFAALGLGGAAVAAVSVSAAVKPAEAETPPGTKGGKHYTESAHVKEYYRVNRY